MTFDESTTILAIIFANYKSSFKDFSEANASAVAKTWSIALANVPFEMVYIAVLKWIEKEKFPPKICEIKHIISCDLYHESFDALTEHKKRNHLSEKAVAKYEYILEVANRMRNNRMELTLSKFIDDDGDFLLLESKGNERWIE